MNCNQYKLLLSKLKQGEIIKKSMKKNDYIYGSQAIAAQVGQVNARPPGDYDMVSRNYNKRAKQIERRMDRTAGCNYYYTKPAIHPGTIKVMSNGRDGRPMTKDDVNIIDVSKPIRRQNTIVVNGTRYVALNEIKKDKLKSLRDKTQKFRHKKDAFDLKMINYHLKKKI